MKREWIGKGFLWDFFAVYSMRDVTSSEYIIRLDEDVERQWPQANGFNEWLLPPRPLFFSSPSPINYSREQKSPFVGHTKQQARENCGESNPRKSQTLAVKDTSGCVQKSTRIVGLFQYQTYSIFYLPV